MESKSNNILDCLTLSQGHQNINRIQFNEIYNIINSWEEEQIEHINENKKEYSSNNKVVRDLLNFKYDKAYYIFENFLVIKYVSPNAFKKFGDMNKVKVSLNIIHNNKILYETSRLNKTSNGYTCDITTDAYGNILLKEKYVTITAYPSVTYSDEFESFRLQYKPHLFSMLLLIFDYLYYMAIIFNLYDKFIPKTVRLIKHKKLVVDKILQINNISTKYVCYLQTGQDYTINDPYILNYNVPCFEFETVTISQLPTNEQNNNKPQEEEKQIELQYADESDQLDIDEDFLYSCDF